VLIMTDSDKESHQLAAACAEELWGRDNASQGLGTQLLEVTPGRAAFTMAVRDDMLNGHKICHGGFIFALADTTFAFACNSRNENNIGQGCSIDYVGPAKLGDKLKATAVEKSRAKRTGLFDVTVKNQNQNQNEDEDVVAFMRGRSYRVRGSVIPE
jgi:acyl-CoA thioesterase